MENKIEKIEEQRIPTNADLAQIFHYAQTRTTGQNNHTIGNLLNNVSARFALCEMRGWTDSDLQNFNLDIQTVKLFVDSKIKLSKDGPGFVWAFDGSPYDNRMLIN